MFKRLFSVILVMVAFSAFTFADGFTVNYVEGLLEINDDGGWYEVFIGDELPENAVLRLDDDSYAEIVKRSEVLKLSRSGVYELDALISARREVRSSGVGNLLSGKFRTLIKEDQSKTQTTVGGVRAADAETASIDWLSSETAGLISEGRASLDEGNVEEALEFFSEAYDYAADSYEEAEALYFMGLSHAVEGKYSKALDNLDEAMMEADSEYYTDYYLLKAQLLNDTFAYEEAYQLLSDYRASVGRANPDKLQEIYFLKAIAANNSGRKATAKSFIEKLIDIDPISETAIAARNYLNNL